MQFSSVVGHHNIRQKLIQSAKESRVSHALLFLGPEGSGNLPIAIAFAQYLVCDNRTDTDSCGTCPSCKKMEKLAHPDVSYSYPVAPKESIKKPKSVDFISHWREAIFENPYIDYNAWMESLDLENKQGSISVEESADIVNRLTLKSVEGGYKIVIIWLPETMNHPAANKLLKILEEPPEQTLFFLVAENHEKLLTTILSRTQLVKINRVSDAEMFDVLVKKHGLDKLAAQRLVHRSDGAYNEALKLLSSDEQNSDLNNQFLSWMRLCLKLNVSGINNFAAEFGKSGRESQKNFLRHAIDIARECMLLNYADRSLVRLEGKDLDDIQRFSPFINEKNIFSFVDELNKSHFHLERNANSKLLITDLSFAVHSLLRSGR